MWVFLIGALAALVAAGASGYKAWSTREARRLLLRTETTTTDTLRELSGAASAAAGAGHFRELVELSGTASVGPGGLLTSPLSKTPCVWHQHRVTRHYEETRRDKDGNRHTDRKEEVMTNERSRDPFLLRDSGGDIIIVPDRNVQQAKKVTSEFRQGTGELPAEGGELTFGSFSFKLPGGFGNRNDTLGFEYEEWVLLPDTRIFVQGEATDATGSLEVREPAAGKLLITTRSEEELVDSHRKTELVSAAIAAGLVVLSLVLVGFGVTR